METLINEDALRKLRKFVAHRDSDFENTLMDVIDSLITEIRALYSDIKVLKNGSQER